MGQIDQTFIAYMKHLTDIVNSEAEPETKSLANQKLVSIMNSLIFEEIQG